MDWKKEELLAEIEQLKKIVNDKDNQIATIRAAHGDLEREWTNTLKVLEKDLEDTRGTLNDAWKRCIIKDEDIEELSKMIYELESENDKLREKHEKATEHVKSWVQEYNDMWESYREMRDEWSEMTHLESREEALKELLKEKDEAYSELFENHNDLVERNKYLTKSNENLNEEINKLNGALEYNQVRIESLEHGLDKQNEIIREKESAIYKESQIAEQMSRMFYDIAKGRVS